jgi:hypothetical protein
MTVGANSYGAASDVAALTELYCISGAYTTATIPTLAQVEGWIDQVSAIMNAALAGSGFVVPVTQADSVLAIKSYVIQAATDLAHAANSAGRFFTDQALQRGVNPMSAIRKEVMDWVGMFADGLAGLGAARSSTTGAGEIGFRDADEGGDETFPIFQREAFGNSFQNWDT